MPEDENLLLSLRWVTGFPGPGNSGAIRADTAGLYLSLADAKLSDRIIRLLREYLGGEVKPFREFDTRSGFASGGRGFPGTLLFL